MPLPWMGLLLAEMVSTPTPQPALKTIITVHSSQFCTDLVLAVRPALAGLMQNDKLIDLGRSALKAGDRDAKFGGQVESSFNQRGAATWTPNEGVAVMLDNRQRQLSAAMAQNIDMVKAVLENPNAPAPDGEDKAKLAAIKAQLAAILAQQRRAIDIMNGTADTSEVASLYDASSRSGVESDYPNEPSTEAGLNGVSSLGARLTTQDNVVRGPGGKGTISTTEPVDASQAAIAKSTAAMPFYSPYDKLVRALEGDQVVIKRSEQTAAETIIEAVEGCE